MGKNKPSPKNVTPQPDGTSKIARHKPASDIPAYKPTKCTDCGGSGESPDGGECGNCSGQGSF